MKKSLEVLIQLLVLLAGALGGALLLLVSSAWWEVISFTLEGHAGTPSIISDHDWLSLAGLKRILLSQAGSMLGPGEMVCGALLGGASALAWRCREKMKHAAATSCASMAWLVLLPVLMWNVWWLFREGLSGHLSSRAELVGLLGFVLNPKLWWAGGLLAFPMRDRKAARAQARVASTCEVPEPVGRCDAAYQKNRKAPA